MAKSEIYGQVDVVLPNHEYSVIVCRNGLSDQDLLASFIASQQVFIVTNQTIASLYLEQVRALFSRYQCDVAILPDGEVFKNQTSLFSIYDSLIQHKHHRDSTLIALGGGVIGDLAGFAASTYQRGIRFIQMPTTLLAQIDASVGGKTAINHPMGKNLIGSFYQPDAVIIDLNTLDTLPEREFRAGLAEMIKYGLLAGGVFFEKLSEALQKGLTNKSSELPQLIIQCCQIKSQIVMRDEKEENLRALLNLGHTFAHALEAYTKYQKWLHGEAVAIGLYCAAVLSNQLGILDQFVLSQIKQMLNDARLSYQVPKSIDIEKLIELMHLDKKIKNNRLQFVLIKKPGDCYLNNKVSEGDLYNALSIAMEGE